MKLLSAYQKLSVLAPTFHTQEAASVLQVSSHYATMILARLAAQNTVIRLARGRWAYSDKVDPLLLPNILTQPMLAYVSLYSALYYHGMIEQIPHTVFAISIGKTKVYQTPIAKVSIHHITPKLFKGYQIIGKHSLLLATPEKALFDTLYLMPARSNIFKCLTELDVPDNFNFALIEHWCALIKSRFRREIITKAIKRLT